jgi:hypothetical protein
VPLDRPIPIAAVRLPSSRRTRQRCFPAAPSRGRIRSSAAATTEFEPGDPYVANAIARDDATERRKRSRGWQHRGGRDWAKRERWPTQSRAIFRTRLTPRLTSASLARACRGAASTGCSRLANCETRGGSGPGPAFVLARLPVGRRPYSPRECEKRVDTLCATRSGASALIRGPGTYWRRRAVMDRHAYERLKRELAAREWTDMNDYADAKGPLIGVKSFSRRSFDAG